MSINMIMIMIMIMIMNMRQRVAYLINNRIIGVCFIVLSPSSCMVSVLYYFLFSSSLRLLLSHLNNTSNELQLPLPTSPLKVHHIAMNTLKEILEEHQVMKNRDECRKEWRTYISDQLNFFVGSLSKVSVT